jgi:hypothetical protein
VPLAADKRFRGVRDPAVFTAVLRTVPVYAAWLDVLDPISPVFPMGGLHTDPAIVARTREVIGRHGGAPPLAQPTREQLLTALDSAG